MLSDYFRHLKEVSSIDLDEIDFLDDATNVYRTNEFIVRQHITFVSNGVGTTRLMSEDIFYLRTELRDYYYDELFENEGKRIHSAMSVRSYIE